MYTGLLGLNPNSCGIAAGNSGMQKPTLHCRQITGGQAQTSVQRWHCLLHVKQSDGYCCGAFYSILNSPIHSVALRAI